MNTNWQRIGELSNGKAIYQSPFGSYAIEQDFRHLVEPNEKERKEIDAMFAVWRVIYPSGGDL